MAPAIFMFGLRCWMKGWRLKAKGWLAVWLVAGPVGTLRAAGPKAPEFGPDVMIFSPAIPMAEIQAQIDKVYAVQ
jgi:hypothetical protein